MVGIPTADAALALDKNSADARHNQALALLLLGDFRRGFEGHEARWQRSGMPVKRRNFGKPLWLGELPACDPANSNYSLLSALNACRNAHLSGAAAWLGQPPARCRESSITPT